MWNFALLSCHGDVSVVRSGSFLSCGGDVSLSCGLWCFCHVMVMCLCCAEWIVFVMW